ncbi:MAG: alanine racemase [Fluviibacter sp.]
MVAPHTKLSGRPLFAEFSANALRHNAHLAKRLMGGQGKIYAVIKADAYGHGLIPVAQALSDLVDGFAILELAAARSLRALDMALPILMLEGFYNEAELIEFSRLGLSTVVHRADQIDTLAKTALENPIPVFMKLNTGMNRLGLSLTEAAASYARLKQLPQVSSVTVMTHFADADNARGTGWQLERLAAGWPEAFDQTLSLGNSAALLDAPADRRVVGDIARPGIMLYGSSPWGGADPAKSAAALGLKPVMTLKSALISVQIIQPGERVGYGGTFTADKPMRIGIVAGGYADGYPRHASNQTPILVNGLHTHLVGRVSMDRLCCDVTDIPEAQLGSPVVLWGDGLPVDTVADSAGTISYELFCALSPRVPHLWRD